MTVDASPRATQTTAPTVLLVTALVGAAASAAFISSQFFLADFTDREAIASTFLVVVNVVVAFAFVALALQLVTVVPFASFPRWTVVVTAAGLAFLAALAWGLGTFGAGAAGVMTEAEFSELSDSLALTVAFVPKMLLCATGLIAIAVTGWRRHALSRGACVVLALAGVASLLPPYPPGALLATIGLAWAVRSATPDW